MRQEVRHRFAEKRITGGRHVGIIIPYFGYYLLLFVKSFKFVVNKINIDIQYTKIFDDLNSTKVKTGLVHICSDQSKTSNGGGFKFEFANNR